ncbi:MAG: saccharopine dehydrogenase NADP-binding domain-containing protein [Chloroflexi bacterium]|nr:saccharopine dehydrogenase NADP-binding domain-containing protein [Chloroflexota bacterium]
MSKILILGGYGYTGKLLAKYLLAETDAEIVITGRSLDKAQAFVTQLGNPRASARQVDATIAATLQPALQGVDLCLVAAPTTSHAETVLYACLAAGADYLDVQLSASKLKALQAAEVQIRQAGRCFVTEAGFHPGLPSAMVRYAAKKLDRIESAVTAGYLNMGHGLPYTEAVDELMEGFIHYEAQVFKNGAWTKPSEWSMTQFDFGSEIGKRSCYSMFFEELRKLPEMYPTLKETGFYISGSNWIADLLITPIVMLGLKLAPKKGLRPLGKLMWWGMQQSPPPYVVMIAVEAKGLKNGMQSTVRAQVSHPDGYELTAIPVVAYLKQYLDGSARRVGLHLMGQLAEPERLFHDMQSMGAKVCVEETSS